jgi:hypothetical protein
MINNEKNLLFKCINFNTAINILTCLASFITSVISLSGLDNSYHLGMYFEYHDTIGIAISALLL